VLPPRLALALATVVPLSLASGCASAPLPKMSFRDAGLSFADEPRLPPVVPASSTSGAVAALQAAPAAGAMVEPVLPPVAVAAPEAVASETPEGPPIDGSLVRFAGEARSRRLGPRGAAFPTEAAAAWRALVEELDGYLARPLPQTPLLELVRAQVTVEAEWDFDQRRFGPAPADLARLVAARAARLRVRIQTSRALGQTMFARRPPGPLRWPIEHAGLSSPFGLRTHPIDGTRHMHAGIDLAAERGRVVNAAARGYVVRAGWVGGYGLMVELRHPGDLTTRYAHMSALLCAPGDAVDAGQALGLVGKTGLSTGPHLHFEVWREGVPRDPLTMLGGGTVLASVGGVGGP